MKIRLICIFLIVFYILQVNVFTAEQMLFSDVTQSDWAYEYILKLQDLGIMSGMGDDSFGLGRTITRAEFATALCNLMKWEEVTSNSSSFTDVDVQLWYFKKIETAFQNGAVPLEMSFRPNDPITREEIAVMSIRALGYENLAKQLKSTSPFSDVSSNASYITIAKDFGIVSGMGDDKFEPYQTAKREQAAAIFVRMYELISNKINFINAFYAISSASQMNKFDFLDAVSFGWSKLETDGNTVILNTTSDNDNEYKIPDGFETPYNAADGKVRMLMVAVNDSESAKIINDSNLRSLAVNEIASAINEGIEKNGSLVRFDGVISDFESLRFDSKDNYISFLSDLRKALSQKQIYVAVHPAVPGNQAYYDGYDFKAIGDIADKVILMAHDFNPKSLTDEQMNQGIVMTPGASQYNVYMAFLAITDKNTGVSDKSKLVLQINFAAVQWKLKDGKIINKTPYTPEYSAVISRIKSGAQIKYSSDFECPYIIFKNTDDDTDNVVWYEDTRSIEFKIRLAEAFRFSGVSLWRLGNIPDDSSDYYLNVFDLVSGLAK